MTTDNQNFDPREELLLRQALRRSHVKAPDVDAAWRDFARQHPDARVMPEPARGRAESFSIRWYHMAASVLLLAVMGLLTYWLTQPDAVATVAPQQVFSRINQLPEVVVTDQVTGQVYHPAESIISFHPTATSAPADAQPHPLTLRVPRGATQQLTLPDGTEVWLNSDSQISFPAHFTGTERKVQFQGEGYFRVAKDAAHPFRIEAPTFSTIVLGTEFNIRAYDSDVSIVSLVEGSVTFSTRRAPIQGTNGYPVLKPGQTAYISIDGAILVEEREAYSFVQWKENLFYFNDTPLRDVICEMGRWYNVDVIIENPDALEANQHVHFAADRNASLQEALDNLNGLGLVQAQLNGQQVRLCILPQDDNTGSVKLQN